MIHNIQDILASYLPVDEIPYTDEWMKKKLKNYFGEEIIITDNKKTCIITLRKYVHDFKTILENKDLRN